MLHTFQMNERGSVATMAGLVITLVAGAVGGGIDFANAQGKRAELQGTVDAAVLAAAASTVDSDEERMAIARDVFLGSYFCEENQCNTPEVSMNGQSVVLTTVAQVKTSVMQVVGWDTIGIAVRSQAQPASGNDVDIVMMLDYSGSMNGSNKYQDMAAAATEFLDSAEARDGDYMSVGIVPFSKYVLSPMNGAYLYDVDARTDLTGSFVVGCVLNREHPYSVNAETPLSAVEGSLWPVYSYVTGTDPSADGYSDDYGPSEPQEMTIEHNDEDYTVRYIDHKPNSGRSQPTYHPNEIDGSYGPHIHGWDELSMTWVGTNPTSVDMRDFLPWDPDAATHGGYGDSETWGTGSDSGLPPSFSQDQLSEDLDTACAQYADRGLWVRALSKDFTDLKTAIASMTPVGLTNIALSLDFGWHMLTSSEPFTEASSGAGAKKVAILLTDGVQTVSAHGTGNVNSVTAANGNIAESCAAMKTDGVEIFTIAFGINDDYTRNLLQDCATDEPYYFEPALGGELDDVFESIFEMISDQHVRLTG